MILIVYFIDSFLTFYNFSSFLLFKSYFIKQQNGFASTPANKNNKNNNQFTPQSSGKKKNEPFRRVREEEVEIDERVKDMSFEAKVSASNQTHKQKNKIKCLQKTSKETLNKEKTNILWPNYFQFFWK